MIKNIRTLEERFRRMKRRFIAIVVILALLLVGCSTFIYLNYDYLAFKYFIAKHYVYTDTLDKLFEEELKRAINGKYYSYFDDMVVSLVTRRIRETGNDKYTYLYFPEKYKQSFSQEKDEASKSELEELNSQTIYMHLTNFSKYTKEYLESNLDGLKQYPYIILDLRDNLGGDISAMNHMVDYFLPKGWVISTDKTRMWDRTNKTKTQQTLSFKKIVILQNRYTASASESFIATLNDNLDNVTLIGERTYGKGIGQYTLPLKRGFAVKATTLMWLTPNGISIEDNGIAPHIPYMGNDIIGFAVEQLTQ